MAAAVPLAAPASKMAVSEGIETGPSFDVGGRCGEPLTQGSYTTRRDPTVSSWNKSWMKIFLSRCRDQLLGTTPLHRVAGKCTRTTAVNEENCHVRLPANQY
jgi:hypothetical protein